MSCLVRDSISSGDRISSEIRSRREISSHPIHIGFGPGLPQSSPLGFPSRARGDPWAGGRLSCGQPTHPGRTRCPPIPLTFTGPRLFTPQWSLSKHPRAGKAYNLPTGRRGHVSNGAHEGPSRPVLTQPVLRGPTPCTTRGWLTPGKAPSINMWASQPHTCSMSVEGCPGRGPCEPSRTARRPPMRSRRRSVPRRAVCLLP